MKTQMNLAGRPALTTIIALAGAAAAFAVPTPARAQSWTSMIDSATPSIFAQTADAGAGRTHRISYYRATRSVPLGALVRASGTASREAWEARAAQDVRKIGVPPAIKADRDGDGVDDAFDRWPNDPTRW